MWQALNEFSDFVLSPADEEGRGAAAADDSSDGAEDRPDDAKAKGDRTRNRSGDDDDVDRSYDHDDGGDPSAEDEDEDGSGDDDGEGGDDAVFYMGGLGVGDFNDMLFHRDDDEGEEEMTPEMEAARRCELEETFAEPLLLGDESDDGFAVGVGGEKGRGRIVMAKENSDNDNDAGNVGCDSVSKGEAEEEEEEEEDESIDEDAVELEEIRRFLDAFDVEARTDEISQLLSANDNDVDDATAAPTPLQEHFQNLVPQRVSYSDFWVRYYYRCDPDRIARRWEREERADELRRRKQQEMRERALKEVSDAALSIGRSAASLLKEGWSGAAGALVGVGDVVEEAATSLRAHQSRGRPPFVMAAVEDDDDSYYEDEEDEEGSDEEGEEDGKEEGWGSDDDSDDDEEKEIILGGEEEDEEDEDEEVIFSEVSLLAGDGGPDVVKLRQSLAQAEEERNTMMQSVEEQSAEICQLRSALERRPSSSSSASEGSGILRLKREAAWLNHLIAATTADGPELRDGSTNALKSILDQMRNDLRCQKLKSSGQSSIPDSIEALEKTIQDLQSKIKGIKQGRQGALLQEQLNRTKAMCDKLRKETEETNRRIAECQARLHTL